MLRIRLWVLFMPMWAKMMLGPVAYAEAREAACSFSHAIACCSNSINSELGIPFMVMVTRVADLSMLIWLFKSSPYGSDI